VNVECCPHASALRNILALGRVAADFEGTSFPREDSGFGICEVVGVARNQLSAKEFCYAIYDLPALADLFRVEARGLLTLT
jgi:hypothetical protein